MEDEEVYNKVLSVWAIIVDPDVDRGRMSADVDGGTISISRVEDESPDEDGGEIVDIHFFDDENQDGYWNMSFLNQVAYIKENGATLEKLASILDGLLAEITPNRGLKAPSTSNMEDIITDEDGCTLVFAETNNPKIVMVSARERKDSFESVLLALDLAEIRRLREIAQYWEKYLEANQ